MRSSCPETRSLSHKPLVARHLRVQESSTPSPVALHGRGTASLAVPVSIGRSGDRVCYIDETGVIRYFLPPSLTMSSSVTEAEMRAWPPIGG